MFVKTYFYRTKENLGNVIKIFYADDDSDDRYLFRAALQEIGVAFHLAEFDNGIALENALAEKDTQSDLVFLDLNMPQKNGLETLASLQALIPEKKLRIILFTTAGNDETIKESFQMNAVLFVRKPSDFVELMATLRFIIDHAAQYKLPVAYENFNFQLTRE